MLGAHARSVAPVALPLPVRLPGNTMLRAYGFIRWARASSDPRAMSAMLSELWPGLPLWAFHVIMYGPSHLVTEDVLNNEVIVSPVTTL